MKKDKLVRVVQKLAEDTIEKEIWIKGQYGYSQRERTESALRRLESLKYMLIQKSNNIQNELKDLIELVGRTIIDVKASKPACAELPNKETEINVPFDGESSEENV